MVDETYLLFEANSVPKKCREHLRKILLRKNNQTEYACAIMLIFAGPVFLTAPLLFRVTDNQWFNYLCVAIATFFFTAGLFRFGYAALFEIIRILWLRVESLSAQEKDATGG